MTKIGVGIAAFLAFTATLSAQETNFTALFDGESLSGWEGNPDWFRVEDDAIVAGSMERAIPHNEFLCTEVQYGDFELRLKVKLKDGKGNAGIQLRSRRVPNSHEVSGYQADMGWNYWGCLYDESRRNRMLAEVLKEVQDEIVRKDDWNEYIIRCEGSRIRLWLNGRQTVDYVEQEEEIAGRGVIGLQIHSGPASEAWYKDIRIRKLDEVLKVAPVTK